MLVSAIPTKMPIIWAQNAGVSYTHVVPIPSQLGVTAGAASFNDGFPPLTFTALNAGGVPPFGIDFNGVCNAITAWNQWQQAGAPVMYDASFCTSGAQNIGGYPKGAVLMSSDQTHTWLNWIDANTSNPDTGGAGWTNLGAQGTASIRNLLITHTNTTATISADEAVLANAQGSTIKVLNVNLTINYAANGTNGLDTGAFAAGTGYHHWLAYNPTTNTICGLGSTVSGTGGPTLPAGFTHRVRVGANFADGSVHFYNVLQKGKTAAFVASSRALATGTSGANTAVSLSGFIPTTAQRVHLIFAGQGNGTELLQPDNTFWSVGSPNWARTDNAWGVGNIMTVPLVMVVPTNGQVYWASNNLADSIQLYAWEDSIIT